MIHKSAECIRRTVAIIAACALNPKVVQVLKMMVAWASKSSGFAGRGRGSLITVEQLVLMFLAFVSNVEKNYMQCDAQSIKKVKELEIGLLCVNSYARYILPFLLLAIHKPYGCPYTAERRTCSD